MMFEKIRSLYGKYREAINYVIVGGMTTVVSLLSYYLCVVTFLDPNVPLQLQMANIISWICAVAFAYVTNRRYVFQSSNANRLKEAAMFVAARLSTLLIDMVCMFLFVTVLQMNDRLAKLLVQFIVFALNYIFSKWIVFRK